MKPINVGVIGAGYWGPNLIRNFYELPGADLKIVCDLREDRLAHICERYPGVRISTNFEDLLQSDVDAVVIATPVSTHFKLASRCLQAGKHILVEKPLAANSSQARQIVDLGREVGRVVMTGHTFIYNSAVNAIKEIISSGEIGQVYYVNSTRVNLGLYQPDINVVWDLAPHDVSILLYVLGIEPVTASARGGMYVKQGIHDVAHMTLNYTGGIMADMHVSWLDPVKIRRITIVGNKKMIVYDDIEPVDKVKIYDKGVDLYPYTDTFEEFHLAYRHGEVVSYPLNWAEPLRAECEHFLDCIGNEKPVLTDGVQGLKVIQILEAAQKSLLNGGLREKIAW